MVLRSDTLSVLSHLEAAVEASCAALVALKAMRAQPAELTCEIRDVEAGIVQTIDWLRSAISELRSLHGEQTSFLAFGFVLETTARRRTGIS